MAYNMFRAAAIFQGVMARALAGNAASALAVETGKRAAPMAALGWKQIERWRTIGTDMEFDYSPKVKDLQARLSAFMDAHVYPNEARFHDEVGEGDRWQPTKSSRS
jgi:hypothetical protein